MILPNCKFASVTDSGPDFRVYVCVACACVVCVRETKNESESDTEGIVCEREGGHL